MKKITYIMVALAGLTFIACNKEKNALPEEETTPAVEEFTYTIAVDADTKAYLDGDHMTWQSGDQIGWFTDKAGSSEINMSTDPRSFEVSSTAAMAAGAKIYAYAPYKAGEQSKTAAPLSIPTAQDGVITDAMPMVSLPISLDAAMAAATDTPIGQASFLSLGAIIQYNVYTTNASYAAEKVEGIQFTSDSNIAGSFTVDLTGVAENAIPAPSGLDQKTVTSTLATATTVGDSKANGIKIYQVIAPGTYSGTITVTTDIATYSYTITDKEFTRGKVKPFNVNLASANATRSFTISGIEKLLKTHSWGLDSVMDGSTNATHSAGNIVTFNADYSYSINCLLNGGKTWDYWYTGNLIVPSYDSKSWSVSKTAGKMFINFTDSGYPVVCVGNTSGVYEITSISTSSLSLLSTEGYQVTMSFSPRRVFDHSFDTGDFGLTDTNIWSDPIIDNFSGKAWRLYNNQGAYKINTPWGWSGTVIWNGWGWEYEPTTVTLSSSSFDETITAIGLDFTIGENWTITVNCSVGDSPFGIENQPFTNTGEEPQQTAIFNGSATGSILISVTQADNTGVPILLRGVHVIETL